MNDLEKLCPKFLQTPNAAGIIAFLFNEFMDLEMRMAVPDAVAQQIGQYMQAYGYGIVFNKFYKQREEQILESVQQDYSYALQHPDDEAVDRFANAMKQKLAQAREKGRSGWQQMNPNELSGMLYEHVAKGDPRDVANFCMFLWNLGQPITPCQPVRPAACQYCNGTGDVHGIDGEWRGQCSECKPAGAQEPVRLNDDDLTKIYMRFVGHQGLYPRLFEDIAGCVMTAMFEKSPPPAAAINNQMLSALRKAEEAMTWELGGEPCGLQTALLEVRSAVAAAEAAAEAQIKESGL